MDYNSLIKGTYERRWKRRRRKDVFDDDDNRPQSRGGNFWKSQTLRHAIPPFRIMKDFDSSCLLFRLSSCLSFRLSEQEDKVTRKRKRTESNREQASMEILPNEIVRICLSWTLPVDLDLSLSSDSDLLYEHLALCLKWMMILNSVCRKWREMIAVQGLFTSAPLNLSLTIGARCISYSVDTYEIFLGREGEENQAKWINKVLQVDVGSPLCVNSYIGDLCLTKQENLFKKEEGRKPRYVSVQYESPNVSKVTLIVNKRESD